MDYGRPFVDHVWMGWNTSALFVMDRSADDLLDFLPDASGYRLTDERVGVEQATSSSPRERLYLADDGTRCQLWDPDLQFVVGVDAMIESGGARFLNGTRALAVIFSSVTSMYGFWLYDDGDLVRRAIYESGELIDSVGRPLPDESDITIPEWGHDEDFVWTMIEKITGLTYSDDQQFAVYTADR
jgi:hypothetical protein